MDKNGVYAAVVVLYWAVIFVFGLGNLIRKEVPASQSPQQGIDQESTLKGSNNLHKASYLCI
jgi:hypothetical protein